MSAIQLVNQVPSSTSPSAEFHVYQGIDRIARIGVHAGGTVSLPVTVVDENNDGSVITAQEWTVYAIVNGITTSSVTTANPNAIITLRADNTGGLSLTVS
jgi:hypothetical protein